MIKKPTRVLFSMAMALSLFVTAPASVNALSYPSWPTEDDIEDAIAEKNFPKPENLKVIKTTDNSVTISWKYADWGYSLAYTDDSDKEPSWTQEFTTRTDGSTGDWKVTIDNLTPGKTYYIYVKHATIDVVKSHAVYLSGEYSMVKVALKADNPITVTSSTKSVKASDVKKDKKTVKVLKISKAKGTVKVTKVKSGTNKKIYSKIKVNKKTGAITLKKGTYKKGTYKVKLKITASGNEGYKSKTLTKKVSINIK